MRKGLAKLHKVRDFDIQAGLPALSSLQAEIMDYWDVLLGRQDPPIHRGVSTLMEVADAYFCRATEIAAQILQREREGLIVKTHRYSKFRTGELRLFMEAAKRAADLGSRRITAKQLQIEEERIGRGRRMED